MRILLCSHYHSSEYIGGNEVYSDSLARALVSKGHELFYLTRYGKPNGVPYEVRSSKSFIYWIKYLFKIRPDVVHTTGTGMWLTLLGIYCWIMHIPRVATFQAPLNSKSWRKIFLLDEWLMVHTSKQIIVTSPLNRQYLLRYDRFRKIAIVLLSLKQRFTPSKLTYTQARKKYGLNRGKKYIFLLAKMDKHHYYKGVEVALNAMKFLPSRYILLIGGSGSEVGVFKNIAEQIGVEQRVQFLGSIPDKELPDYYRSCNVHIMPSTSRSEGFGLVLLEAMISKIPTIATNVVGISPLLKRKGIATVICENDAKQLSVAIQRIVTKNNNNMLQKAYLFAQSCSIDTMVKETIEVYEHALSK